MAGATTWKVTGQLDGQLNIGATGNPVTGVQVSFTTGLGNSGTVFVPDSIYPDARATWTVINDRAVLLDAVSGLTHASYPG